MEKDLEIREEEMPKAETETIEQKIETAEVVVEETEVIEEEEPVIEEEELDTDPGFEEMLEESLSGITDYQIGDKVSGEVINITDSLIFITLGGKRDAYAEKSEFADKNGKLELKVGDKLEGYISKYSDTETCISPSLIGVNLQILREAYEQKIPVSGKILSMIKGGFLVDISGIRGFCPMSQVSNKMVPDYKVYLSNNYDFRVIDFTEKGKNIVVSRRALLEEKEQEQRSLTLSKIQLDDIVKGKVVRLTNFGAFIDIGGVEGLLHISEFSHTRVESPSDMVSIGDEVEVKIIRMKGDKVSLSFKALSPDPTDLVLAELQEGDVIKCRVLRNLPFGSFVEIKPGVEGLIPISEMDRNRRVVNANDILKPGDYVEVQVLKVKLEERKVSLSLKALQPDPWESIKNEVEVGEVITGRIENVANFGTFIRLKEGITGLLPNSKMKIAGLTFTKENIGEEFMVRVSRIDPDNRRISLEPTDMPEQEPRPARGERDNNRDKDRDGDWRQYKQEKKNEVDEDNPFSAL
ncbi:MAG: S1 RNA-binding domain-containing protein [Candidatus Cloacimonetes bacterium]|nr:S1 RNA-binding domain-containing protein [Candidatus Cloacimonadota bacterium]